MNSVALLQTVHPLHVEPLPQNSPAHSHIRSDVGVEFAVTTALESQTVKSAHVRSVVAVDAVRSYCVAG